MNQQEVAKAARFTVGDQVRLSSAVIWTVTHCSWDEQHGILYDLRAYEMHLHRIKEDHLVSAGRMVPVTRRSFSHGTSDAAA
jgi:hypothetical protein